MQPPRTPGFPCPGDRPAHSFPAPRPSPPSLETLSPCRDLPGVFYASERISVNGCLSQGHLRFRMQLSRWDWRLSVLKCLWIIQPASPPVLASNSHFLNTWCPRLGHTLSHREQETQACCPLEAYVLVVKTDKGQVHKCTNTCPIKSGKMSPQPPKTPITRGNDF